MGSGRKALEIFSRTRCLQHVRVAAQHGRRTAPVAKSLITTRLWTRERRTYVISSGWMFAPEGHDPTSAKQWEISSKRDGSMLAKEMPQIRITGWCWPYLCRWEILCSIAFAWISKRTPKFQRKFHEWNWLCCWKMLACWSYFVCILNGFDTCMALN